MLDPATGALLSEGEWPETPAVPDVDLRVALPPEDGPYRVQVAPVEDRGRIRFDRRAHVRRERWSWMRRAWHRPPSCAWRVRFAPIPKAFIYPARSIVEQSQADRAPWCGATFWRAIAAASAGRCGPF